MLAAASTRIAAAPGEEAVATAMSMPGDEAALDPEPDTAVEATVMSMPEKEEKPAKDEGKDAGKDEGKGGKDEGKEGGKDEGKDKDTAKMEEVAASDEDKSGGVNATADTLSGNSANDFGSNFAIHAMSVAALTAGLWF